MLERVQHFDIAALRRDARDRALTRARPPFDGAIIEDAVGDDHRPARWYVPEERGHPEIGVVFLHGGYGVFGDLELQDGYCRRIAGGLGVPVISVDYRLAPEAALADSAIDAVAGVRALREAGMRRVVLWGDSAGGAVAIAASRDTAVDGLMLTNPNVDLTLVSFDDQATGGPDRALSEWSFARWAGAGTLGDSPDLAALVDFAVGSLPALYVAVGSQDSLLPDARRLASVSRDAGVPVRLRVVPGAEHGFMAGPDLEVADDVIRDAGRFLAVTPS